MQQKSQKGFNIIELLIIVVMILIIVAIAVPNILRMRNGSQFKESFEVEIDISRINDEERQIIQQFVTKKLQRLRNNLETVQKEKADLLLLPEITTSAEAMRRIINLREIKAELTSVFDTLSKAEYLAEYFGFKT